MNKIRHEVRLEKFRQLKEAITKPAFVQKALARFGGELACIYEQDMKLTPKQIEASRKSYSPTLLESIRNVKPPTGWRKKAIIIINKTSHKELHPKTFVHGDGAFNFGKQMGLAGDIGNEIEKTTNRPEVCDFFDAAVMPLLLRKEDIPQFEKGVNLIQNAIEQVPTRSRTEQKSYYSGLSTGTKGLVNDESKYTFGHNSSEIYLDLLMLDEYLDCLPTRKQLHQFLGYLNGEKEAGKFSTFEKLCENIGYLTPSQIRKRKKAQGKCHHRAF